MHRVILFAVIAALPIAASAGGKPAKPIVIASELNANDAKDTKLKASYAKGHKLKLTKGVAYVIDLASKDFDAFLRLEDAAGKQLAEDDDGGEAPNARLFFIPPETAEYAVIATSYKPKTGKYRLTVQETKFDATPFAVADGVTKDRLAPTGPRSPFSPGNVCKTYRVHLMRGMSYVIDLESNSFDAYLSLADASLRRLAFDDDSGGNRNARIRLDCTVTGAYYIVATGLGSPAGEFTLKVRAAK